MGGFVYYEDNNGSTTAKSMPECQAFCDRYPDCKVYSFDGQNCKIYYDYKSVVGKGGYSDHYLDGVSPDGTVVTGVKPFSSTDPTGWGSDTMGKSQFAWIHGAQIDGTPYKTFPNMLDCVQECRQNDSCQAVARPDSITPCGVYNSIDLRRNIKPGSASFTNNTWVKLKSSS
jgi:hypothetical protein